MCYKYICKQSRAVINGLKKHFLLNEEINACGNMKKLPDDKTNDS